MISDTLFSLWAKSSSSALVRNPSSANFCSKYIRSASNFTMIAFTFCLLSISVKRRKLGFTSDWKQGRDGSRVLPESESADLDACRLEYSCGWSIVTALHSGRTECGFGETGNSSSTEGYRFSAVWT